MLEFLIASFLVVVGLVMLSVGAEGLVEGSLRLSQRLGLSPLVAGLTVVAFGTSAPELGVSLAAAIKGVPDIALGNVVGSNIANALLIVGIGAIVRPFSSRSRLVVKREVPILLSMTLLCYIIAYSTKSLNELFGILNITAFFVYLAFLYRGKRPPEIVLEEAQKTQGKRQQSLIDALMLSGGLVLLFLGSKVFLLGAVRVGHLLGVPDLFIGLTLTAIGTSLPEMAATVSAARRNQGDIIMGNVLGSNISNLCLVLGLTALIVPIPIPREALLRDIPFMIASTTILFPLMLQKKGISRAQGAGLVAIYILYLLFLRGAQAGI